jgi:hypothetical protein
VTLCLLRLSLSCVVSRKSEMDQPGVVPDLLDTEQKTHLTFQAAIRWVGFIAGPAVPPPLLIRQKLDRIRDSFRAELQKLSRSSPAPAGSDRTFSACSISSATAIRAAGGWTAEPSTTAHKRGEIRQRDRRHLQRPHCNHLSALSDGGLIS